MQARDGKWWHVADEDVEELVAKLGGEDPFRPPTAPTVVVAGGRPPKPRVANSPRLANAFVPAVSPSPAPATRVTNSPRPHVAPGTPLMSHRISTPRSRPASARRSAIPQKNDGKITVYAHNLHSADKLVLRLYPELQIGSCSTSNVDNTHRVSCDEVDDLAENRTQPSFKSEIARSLGIDAQQIRLLFHGTPLGDDEKTLKCYGITDGEMVHFRIHRTPSVGRNDVVLACAAKKCLEAAEGEKDERLCMRAYAMQSPRAKARMDQRCAQNGAALMPKWVSQERPKYFAPCGVAVDGQGGDCAFEEFNMQGIWTPPVDHPHQRGQNQNQYGMQRVREGAHRIAANPCFVGGA